MSHFIARRSLPDEASTASLGEELSRVVRRGDLILLAGELGAGKTTLARGFITALRSGTAAIEVPSPSFTIVQTYDDGRLPVAHLDLFRLRSFEEIEELGLEDLLSSHAVLVEWPDLLAGILPTDHLLVTLEQQGGSRMAILQGHGSWSHRLNRLEAARDFLEGTPWKNYERIFFEGDASTRRYERLRNGAKRAVLMDMPPRPDGPVVREGRSYSSIAHLAEDVRSVVAITDALLAKGISAARIYSRDMERGFLVIEDLGDQLYGRVMRERGDIAELMTMAVTLLADMAAMEWPSVTQLPDGIEYRLPLYDKEALEIEVELLLDWFWPLVKGNTASKSVRGEFLEIWRNFWPEVMHSRRVWTLRDFHSPNLLWLPQRQGTSRVGVIDTQDAVMGHPAYDLASLLQDARIYIKDETATELLDYYCAYRAAAEANFDENDLRTAYLILGTQRLTKILGIFARLNLRDGKPDYLKHLGILSRYLETNLRSPVLKDLKNWYDQYLPQQIREVKASG